MAIKIRRNLPWGRTSSAELQQDGADKIPDSVRKAGFKATGNKAAVGEYIDHIMYEAQYDAILGSAAQLAIDAAQITWSNSNARFENKLGAEVVLGDYARIGVIGMDTLTDDLVIDNVVGLEMSHLGGTQQQSGDDPKFRLGDSGGGVPYKIMLGANTSGCKLDLMTDKPFRELPLSLAMQNKWYVANQGVRNHITVNGDVIYNPSEAGQIIQLDTPPVNPYLIRMDGQILAFKANGAAIPEAWFRDLNIALDGIRFDGTNYIEDPSRFTTTAILGGFPYLFQVNAANRFFVDISSLDSRIHQRTDPLGISLAGLANFVNGSNVVTFVSPGAGSAKNNMRINGASTQGIPDGATDTTVIKNVNTLTSTAEMYNALTGAAVNATATANNISITLDNSGAAGGSHDDDYFQGHIFYNGIADDVNLAYVYGGTTNEAPGLATHSMGSVASPVPVNQGLTSNPKTDGVNGVPRTHDQTQPMTSGGYFYYKA